jgi:hypothetical protein
MATGKDLRRLALALEGTTEAPHFDRLAFKVARIYVTLDADGRTANFKFTPTSSGSNVSPRRRPSGPFPTNGASRAGPPAPWRSSPRPSSKARCRRLGLMPLTRRSRAGAGRGDRASVIGGRDQATVKCLRRNGTGALTKPQMRNATVPSGELPTHPAAMSITQRSLAGIWQEPACAPYAPHGSQSNGMPMRRNGRAPTVSTGAARAAMGVVMGASVR